MARPLTHDEFMTKVYRDLGLKKPSEKKNEADIYIYERQRNYGRKDAMHKKRRPGFRSK